MGGSACSENESCCIVLYLLEFKNYLLLCNAHAHPHTHKVNMMNLDHLYTHDTDMHMHMFSVWF